MDRSPQGTKLVGVGVGPGIAAVIGAGRFDVGRLGPWWDA
jgi:hypothetical protein